MQNEDDRLASGGMVERLRRTQELGERPDTGDEEILAAASDLVAWGEPDAARRVLEVLRRRTDAYQNEIAAIDRLINAPPDRVNDYDETRAAAAVATADDPTANPIALIRAANHLITWGALDEADRALERLERYRRFAEVAERFKALSRQLRGSGVMEAMAVRPDREPNPFNRPREVLFADGRGAPGTALIVFTGKQRNFWLSLQVLHYLLRKRAERIIYLHDQTMTLYLNGLQSVAPSYRELLGFLRKSLKEMGIRETRVIATSTGGFMGLRAAADLPAKHFLGFGGKTSLAGNMQLYPIEKKAMERASDSSLMIDLREYLQPRMTPKRITLYASEGHGVDVAHAKNLSVLPRVRMCLLPGDRHDTVPVLLESGDFDKALDEAFADD